MKKKYGKPALLISILLLVGIYFYFDLGRYLTLENLKLQQNNIARFYDQNTVLTIFVYFVIYVVTTALSFPGATVLTLAGAAVFGLTTGTIIVSFASTIGASLAFLGARFLFRDAVQSRFQQHLETINEGVRKEGEFYLFTLRLIPLFPFFMINLVMGLTPISLFKYFIVSQIGMLPGTLVYVFAGVKLSEISSLGDIFSPDILVAFSLIGLFPLIAKKLIGGIKMRKNYKKFKKPKTFDYNLVVIGAGSGGLVSSYIAAAVKAKVALIEKNKMGGDCLNTGCVPSKALIKSAKLLSYQARAKEFGFQSIDIQQRFSDIMERVQRVIKQIEPHDSIERYSKLGVECIEGEAKIIDPFRVQVNDKTLTTRNIIIATGAGPLIPPFEGLDQINYLTSDTIWNLRDLPKRLIVLGGGPIGAELTQAFARLGSQVTVIEMMPHLLLREDDEVIQTVTEKFEKEGIQVLTNHKAKKFVVENNEKSLICEHDGSEVRIPFDEVLIALGRKANTSGFGAEELGIELTPGKTFTADPYLRTNFPNILVCGDVTGPYQFTHTASHQAWYATVNALFSPFKKFRADYRVIPWCTYTDPEVARVGINEKDAKNQEIPYEVTHYNIEELDRAIAENENHGMVKVLTVPGKDKILGVTIVGEHAGDYITEFVLAMKYGIGLNKILGTIHIYPTLGEANKYVAGEWKKSHAPEKALRFLKKFHQWRRG